MKNNTYGDDNGIIYVQTYILCTMYYTLYCVPCYILYGLKYILFWQRDDDDTQNGKSKIISSTIATEHT